MKYLKRFESKINFEELLHDFCNTHLAYLTDNGFCIELYQVKAEPGSGGYEIFIQMSDVEGDDGYYQPMFDWEDVKDHIVPFIIHLNREFRLYTTTDDEIGYVQSTDYNIFESFTLDEVIDINFDPFSEQKLSPFTPVGKKRKDIKIECVNIYSVFEK